MSGPISGASGRTHSLDLHRLLFQEHSTDDVEDGHGAAVDGKWIYVFKVRQGRGTTRTSLAAEVLIQDGTYAFVNWAKGHRNAGVDDRKTGQTRQDYALWNDSRVQATHVFLSDRQLPYARLREYRTDPQLLTGRSVTVDRSQPWMSPASDGKHWIMHLVDPIAIAKQKRRAYDRQQSAYEKEAGDPTQTLRRMHAHLSWMVAEEMAKEDSDAWDWIRRKALKQYLDSEESRLLAQQRRRDRASRGLSSWLTSEIYRMAREDLSADEEGLLEAETHEAAMIDGFLNHAIGQRHLEQEVTDSESWLSRYLYNPAAFELLRKTGETRDALVTLLEQTAAAKIKLRGVGAAQEIMLSTKVFFSLHADFRMVNGVNMWVGAKGFVGVEQHGSITAQQLAKNEERWKKALGGKYTPRFMAAIQLINLAFAGVALRESKTTQEKIRNSAGVIGSVADSVAALEYVLAKRLGQQVFKIAAVVGGVLDYVGAVWNAAEESSKGNTGLAAGYGVTAVGATLIGAAGALELAGGGTAMAMGAGALTLVGAAVVLLGALILYLFTESPLEEWLKDSHWGVRNTGRALRDDLSELLRLIGHPRVRVRLEPYDKPMMNMGRIDGNHKWLTSKTVTVHVEPLFFLEGQTSYELEVDVHCHYEGSVRGVDDSIFGQFDFLKDQTWRIPGRDGRVHRKDGAIRGFSRDWSVKSLLDKQKLFPGVDRADKITFRYQMKARFARQMKEPITYKGQGVAFDRFDYQLDHQD